MKTHLTLITVASVALALVITYEEQLGSFALGVWWWVFGSGAPPA